MKLQKVRISEYKSIWDSTWFDISDITCLVGKNEAGKTAILEALYKVNPIVEDDGEFDVIDEYPRMEVSDYQMDVEEGNRKQAIVAKAVFKIEGTDVTELDKDFPGVLTNSELTLSKGYGNRLQVGLSLDEARFVKVLISGLEVDPDTLKHLEEIGTIDDLKIALEELAEEKTGAKEFLEEFSDVLSESPVIYVYRQYLEHRVPKFLYFNEFYQMEGQVNLNALIERRKIGDLKDSDRPLLGLIQLARLNLDEVINPSRTQELVAKLEGAKNRLTKRILKYWSQNKHLELEFDIRQAAPGDPEGMTEGVNFWGEVHNKRHNATTLLGNRSRGFVWFFSFLAWFDQQKQTGEPIILLLDEPGLFLHAKAQGDLLQYIEEELKPGHQVIYTTHSPFMIDSAHFDRVRIVEDKSMEHEGPISKDNDGTKVITDVLETSAESLFPLQGALGYELTQTLFIGPNSLIVEGVSDLLYIQAMSAILQESGKSGLDTNWTITPVGGSDKVITFVSLLGAQQDLNIATLIDIQKKDEQSIENLYKKKLLAKRNVLTYADFNEETEADVEDMFKVDFYLSLVNKEYAKDLASPIEESSLPKGKRIVERVEAYLKKNPLENGARFNHYRPARYFAENSASLKADLSGQTLKRFDDAFIALNGLVK